MGNQLSLAATRIAPEVRDRVSIPKPNTPSVAQDTSEGAQQRLVMFDAMRTIAAATVVFVHAAAFGPWASVATGANFGVVFFTIAGMILLARSIARKPTLTLRDYVLQRVVRLLLPFVIWSAIYVAFFWILHTLSGHRDWEHYGFGRASILSTLVSFACGGAATHLWFIPFILLGCIGAFPLLKLAHIRPASRYWLVPLLLLLGCAALWMRRAFPGMPFGTRVFLSYSIATLPTLFWAIALAMVYPKQIVRPWAVAFSASGLLAFLVLAWMEWKNARSPLTQALKGLAVGNIALSPWTPALFNVLSTLGSLSFGVYLVHLLVLHVLQQLGRLVLEPTSLLFAPLLAVSTLVISYACAIAANRTKRGKMLFP